MKISYRTHPALERFETGKLSVLSILPGDSDYLIKNADAIKVAFKDYASQNSKYYYLSSAFKEAFNIAGSKLTNSNLWQNVDDGSYCFIDPTDCFSLKIVNDKEKGILGFESVGFINESKNDKDLLLMTHFISGALVYDLDKDDQGLFRLVGHDGFQSCALNNFHPEGIIQIISTYITLLLFIKYANVQTKELPAGQKIKGINCKYINETKSNVHMLDVTWITNFIKSDGFNVRGHFRLQPKKKDGEWTKELIWINEFQKEGYTRQAGILNQQTA